MKSQLLKHVHQIASRKYILPIAFGVIIFLIFLGIFLGFERLFLGFTILVISTFWIALIFAFAHEFGWWLTILGVIIWLALILKSVENDRILGEECSKSYSLYGAYCE